MMRHSKRKHVLCAVGGFLGLMVSNGVWASDIPSEDEADEIKYRIGNVYNNGGAYALREEVLNCYHRNMPSFAGIEKDMAKQRNAIRKSIGLKYCALKYERARIFIYKLVADESIYKMEEEKDPLTKGMIQWFSNNTAYQSTGLYERLIFWNIESQQHFMGDLLIQKIDMWPQ